MNKIIDCFTFFNELDLLEIRLKYLYDSVDYFVIVEADTSFNGKSKKLIFQGNMKRFFPFMEKIIYVPINMKYFDEGKRVAWKREEYQRNCIKEGLKKLNLKDKDLVLIGDIDEIPNKDILIDLKKNQIINSIIKKQFKVVLILKAFSYLFNIFFNKIVNKDIWKLNLQLKLIYLTLIKKHHPPLNFKMYNYYYYLNYQKKDGGWVGIQCLQVKLLKEFTANEVRAFRFSPIETINNGGWHFSYLGGKEMIKYKIRNFSHQEYNIPEILDDEYIDFCINNGYSLFDYYRNPNTRPKYKKKDISHLPQDLLNVVISYKNLIFNN